MNLFIGIGIVASAAWLLIKQYDMRMVPVAAGLLMAGIALDPLTALDEFAQKMVTDSLIQAVCSAMGFSFVMRHTGCEEKLIQILAPFLRCAGPLLVPGTTLLTFCCNALFLSAANTAAVMGVILIPLLSAVGISPTLAASALLAGTFGSMLNPALAINTFVARTASTSPDAVTQANTLPVVAALACVVFALGMAAFKETKKNFDPPSEPLSCRSHFVAMVPCIPLCILLLGASGLVPPLRMGVAQSMLVGTLLGVVLSRNGPSEMTHAFFEGMGSAYGSVMGVIISVGIFVRGLKSIGLVGIWITWITTTPELARLGASLGPFLLGVITGSGDAAAFAFNDAVAPHAASFGMDTASMGGMAALAGALGRTLSPLSAAAIVCAAIARVNPMDLTKRNAPGLMVAIALASFLS